MLVSNGLKSFLSTLVQRLLSSRVARMAMKGSQWIEMVCHYPRLISLVPLYRIEFTSCTFLLSLIAETPQHSICSGPCILPIISGRSNYLEPQRESLSLHIPCTVNDWSAFGGIGCLPTNSAYTAYKASTQNLDNQGMTSWRRMRFWGASSKQLRKFPMQEVCTNFKVHVCLDYVY